jgi:uncharacterized protein YndB with AHSA1/START domain
MMTTANSSSTNPELVLTRIFDAPRELVFKVWTEPKHFAQWWGPKGFSAPVCELDVRPGGAILVHMMGEDGIEIPMRGLFQEIDAPNRLVFTTFAFEDAQGNPQIENVNTVTFEALEGSKTRLTLHAVVTKHTPEVAASLAGMEQGWSESLDKLADVVNQL